MCCSPLVYFRSSFIINWVKHSVSTVVSSLFFVVSRHTHGSYRIDNLIVQGDAQNIPLKQGEKIAAVWGGEASRQNEQNSTPLKTND